MKILHTTTLLNKIKRIGKFISFISILTLFPPLSVLALDFDAIDDIVVCGSDASLDNLDQNGGLTFSLWMKPNSMGESNGAVLIGKSNGAGDLRFAFAGTNALGFTKDYNTNDFNLTSSNNTILLNKWSHIVVTWDGSDTATNAHIYIDGKETTYQTTTNGTGGKISDAALNMNVGNLTGTFHTFNGSISDVRVYNRPLAASEARMLYRGLASRNKLVGFWPLIGNTSGTFEPDFSGYKNHCTRTSGPVRGALSPVTSRFRR